jgi:transposase
MREVDNGRTLAEVARQLELSPHLLDRWRSEWRAKGELSFPGIGRGNTPSAFNDVQRIAELERKIGQLTMENDFLKKALHHFKDLHPPAVVNGAAACLRKSSTPSKKAKAKP